MSTGKVTEANWYDYPQYYDLSFRSETRREVRFIEAACRRFCPFPVRRLLEPACGSGRLVRALAARGYDVVGLDICRPALDYLRRRLDARGLKATLIQADMSDFRLPRPVDAAYCTFNSFRHLLTEEQAESHLRCVANSLRVGGIYILGMHLIPTGATDSCVERWSARHGRLQVTVTLRVLKMDWRRRVEQVRVNVLAKTPRSVRRLRSDFPLRLYRARHVRQLFAKVPEFRLLEVYDFWYDIDDPVRLNDELNDAVFILQRVDPSRGTPAGNGRARSGAGRT